MEIGETLHWVWTLGLTAWVLWQDGRLKGRVKWLNEHVDGMLKVQGRILDTLRKGSKKV